MRVFLNYVVGVCLLILLTVSVMVGVLFLSHIEAPAGVAVDPVSGNCYRLVYPAGRPISTDGVLCPYGVK